MRRPRDPWGCSPRGCPGSHRGLLPAAIPPWKRTCILSFLGLQGMDRARSPSTSVGGDRRSGGSTTEGERGRPRVGRSSGGSRSRALLIPPVLHTVRVAFERARLGGVQAIVAVSITIAGEGAAGQHPRDLSSLPLRMGLIPPSSRVLPGSRVGGFRSSRGGRSRGRILILTSPRALRAASRCRRVLSPALPAPRSPRRPRGPYARAC